MKSLTFLLFATFSLSALAYDRSLCVKAVSKNQEINEQLSSKYVEMIRGSSYLQNNDVIGTKEDTVVSMTLNVVNSADQTAEQLSVVAMMYEFSGLDEQGKLVKRDRRLGGIFDIQAKLAVKKLEASKSRLDSLVPEIRNSVMSQDSKDARDQVGKLIDSYQVCKK